jgi:hypothetical protein
MKTSGYRDRLGTSGTGSDRRNSLISREKIAELQWPTRLAVPV